MPPEPRSTRAVTDHERTVYVDWLGIAPDQLPPDYYGLLGLSRFEPNPDRIRQAAEKRREQVRLRSTQNRKLGQAILERLARAEQCLLDDSSRAAYDEKLRRTAAAELPARELRGARFESAESGRGTIVEPGAVRHPARLPRQPDAPRATLVETPNSQVPRRTMVEPVALATESRTMVESAAPATPSSTMVEPDLPHRPATLVEDTVSQRDLARTLVEPTAAVPAGTRVELIPILRDPGKTVTETAPTLLEPAEFNGDPPVGLATPQPHTLAEPVAYGSYWPTSKQAALNPKPHGKPRRNRLATLTLVLMCFSSLAVSAAAVVFIVTRVTAPESGNTAMGLQSDSDPTDSVAQSRQVRSEPRDSPQPRDPRMNAATSTPSGDSTETASRPPTVKLPSSNEAPSPVPSVPAPHTPIRAFPENPLQGLVEQCNVPPREDGTLVDLGSAEPADRAAWRWHVEGQSDSGPRLLVGELVAEPANGHWPVLCQSSAGSVDASAPVVARLHIREGRLQFGWEPDNAGLYRPHFLAFRLRVECGSNDRSIALRQWTRTEPIQIGFRELKVTVPISLPFEVAEDTLRFEVTSIANMPLLNEKPYPGNAFPVVLKADDKKRNLFLHESGWLFVEMQLRVFDGQPHLLLRPRFKLSDKGEDKSAVLDEVEKQIKTLAKNLARYQRDLVQAQDHLRRLEDVELPRLNTLRNQYPIDSPLRQQAEVDFVAAQAKIQSTASRIESRQKAIPATVQTRERLLSLHQLLKDAEQRQPVLNFQVTQVVAGESGQEDRSVLVSSHE